jgi:tetratricopeptide (TPR) repeat protein
MIRLVVALLLVPTLAAASPESRALRMRAITSAYNLDYEQATREMEAAVKADPRDAAAQRGLAMIPWLMISFRRGAVTVDDYLGSISKQNVAMRQPPADLAQRFHTHIGRTLQLAEQAAAARPSDPEALYQLGHAVGLQASYVATVEGRVLGAFRAARRSYDAHEQVLALAPTRKDAGLVVGMYRYVVSQMSLPIRLLAYVAGFGGDGERGIHMIEEASRYPGEGAADAKFALVLVYNREARYGDALRVLEQLQKEFPRNRILWLEAGATLLRAGRPADAERVLSEGLDKMHADTRPRMLGEEALWLVKRATARLSLGRHEPAQVDLKRALGLESRKWVTGRAHAELGKLADVRGDRATARREFERAVVLATEDNDPIGAEAAERWVSRPYRP